MGIFDSKIKTVKRLIEKYGQTVTLTNIAFTAEDSNKPWDQTEDTTPDPETINLKMVFLSPSASGLSMIGKELLQYLGGSDINSGKVRGFLAPSSYVPKLNDIISRDSEELKICAIDTLSPNGQIIMHILEFDR